MAGRLRQPLPHVEERAGPYESHREKFAEQNCRCSTVHANLIVLDLPGEEIIFSGNRFMIHAPFPEVNISIRAIRGLSGTNMVFAVGKFVFNRTSRAGPTAARRREFSKRLSARSTRMAERQE